jgi:ATP-dependent Clp protease adapter protein ClpS
VGLGEALEGWSNIWSRKVIVMNSGTITIEKTDLDKGPNKMGHYAVKAYNNEVTPFDRVMGVFIISCGYSEAIAKKYTMQIHQAGSSVCYWASKEACEEVVGDFKKIGVKAEVIDSN